MRKVMYGLIAFTCLLLLITSGIIFAVDAPEKIVIDGKNYKKDIKGPVTFSHSKHNKEYGVKCLECHHDYKDGVNIWKEGNEVKKCSECHDANITEGNVKKLMMAFHDNCKNCHKEKAKEGIDAPEKKCESCHSEKAKPAE